MKTLRFLLPFLLTVLVACGSVSTQTARIAYTVSSLPAACPTTFPFNRTATVPDLVVLDGGATNSGNSPPVTLTYNSDYTVTGGGYNSQNQLQNGTVTIISGGAHNVQVGDVITILRNTPFTQTTTFSSTGFMSPLMIEAGLDKLTTETQQLKDLFATTLHFPSNETTSGELLLDSRKSSVLGFDSAGNIAFYAFAGGAIVPQSVAGTAGQVLVNGSSGTPVTGAVVLTLAGGTPSLTGTASQVLVNGTSGTPTQGPIILTTPQNIATTSTPQFARLGVGTATSTTSDVLVVHSVPTANASASVLVQGALAAPAATDLHPNAYRDTTIFTSTVGADAYASFDANAGLAGSSAYNHFIGFQARNSYQGLNTLSRLEGFAGFMTVTAGTVTEARVFYVPDLSVVGGSVGHYSGLYIDQLTAGTTRHAIYAAGNDPWFSAGGQIFTSALLTTPAGATTCRLGATFDQTSQTGVAIMNSNATATGTFISFCNSGGTVQGTISQSDATTVAYNTTSDVRLKENIRDLPDSGKIIDGMRPRLFDWKWGGKDRHGFIAQELNEVYPEAVTQGETWSVDYAKVTPVLTAQVKDLRARVSHLEKIQLLSLIGFGLLGSMQIYSLAKRKTP